MDVNHKEDVLAIMEASICGSESLERAVGYVVLMSSQLCCEEPAGTAAMGACAAMNADA
jgi:hypothetical protein